MHAVRLEQFARARGIVSLLEKEIRHRGMRQPGDLLRERQHQDRMDHAGGNSRQRIAAFDRFRNLVKQLVSG